MGLVTHRSRGESIVDRRGLLQLIKKFLQREREKRNTRIFYLRHPPPLLRRKLLGEETNLLLLGGEGGMRNTRGALTLFLLRKIGLWSYLNRNLLISIKLIAWD